MIYEFFIFISPWVDAFFLLYFSSINIIYTVLLALGAYKIYHRQTELNLEDFTSILRSNSLPEITFLVTLYNKPTSALLLVDNLLNLTYRYKQILIVNDGSTDNSFEIFREKYQLIKIPIFYKTILPSKPIRGVYRSKLFPEILFIDKENGQKSDALNAGLNACKNPYFITVDDDTFIDNEGFEALIRPMLFSPDIVATGASIRIVNGCDLNFNCITTDKFPRSYIDAMQSVEYFRAFLMRQGWDYAGGNFVISGAFAILSTDTIMKIGGYAPTNADDLEIIVRLNRVLKDLHTTYTTCYLPDPVAWTEGPKTLKVLGRQRMVWHRGLLESIWFHKKLFFNPKYGAFGLFVVPFMVLGEALEPVVETLGYLYLIAVIFFGISSLSYVFLLLAIIWGFNFLYTLSCLLIEELTFRKYRTNRSLALLIYYTIIENVGYRQLTLIWRLNGILNFFKRFKKIKETSKALNKSIEEIIQKEHADDKLFRKENQL